MLTSYFPPSGRKRRSFVTLRAVMTGGYDSGKCVAFSQRTFKPNSQLPFIFRTASRKSGRKPFRISVTASGVTQVHR